MGPFIIDLTLDFCLLLKRQLVRLNYLLALVFLIIGLQCYNAQETSTLRLVNGETPKEGRVEIDLGDGRGWGTICDNGWDYYDATAVCKQIGYPAATFSTLGARFGGNPSLPILLENVACDATHARIDECPSGNSSASCDHTNDAGVKCMVPGFLGCYTLLEIGSRTWTLLDNSNDLCITHCKDLNYRYAGLSGSSCTCGNNHRFYFNNQYPDSHCYSNCKGDATQLCGNSVLHYFSVFDTTLGVCEDPGIPQKGNRSGDNFSFASKVTFSCHDDHVLVGDPILQCVLGDSPHDVKWNGTPPECVSLRLPSATSIPKVRTSPGGDITVNLMTSSEHRSTLQNHNQTMSSGHHVINYIGICIPSGLLFLVIIVITVVAVVRKKSQKKSTVSTLEPNESDNYMPLHVKSGLGFDDRSGTTDGRGSGYRQTVTSDTYQELNAPPQRSSGTHRGPEKARRTDDNQEDIYPEYDDISSTGALGGQQAKDQKGTDEDERTVSSGIHLYGNQQVIDLRQKREERVNLSART